MSSTAGFRPGGFGQALAVLHAVLARGGDQHLDVAHRRGAGPDDAEVEADFVQRERDVLVGLGLDLQFHLLFAQAGRQHDLLGDDGRLRHRHHDLLGLGAALGDDAPHGVGHLVELLDLAVGDPALLEGLGGKALEHQLAAGGLAQLDQLDAGRADVQPDHWRGAFAPSKLAQKAHVT